MRRRPARSASRGTATTWLRGTITAAAVRSPKSSARDAISLLRSSSDPDWAASSTRCWSSSVERRVSVKEVASPNGLRTRLELAVRNQTSGRPSQARAWSGRATSSA